MAANRGKQPAKNLGVLRVMLDIIKQDNNLHNRFSTKTAAEIDLHKRSGREGDERSNHLSRASPFSGSPPLQTQRSCRLRRRVTNGWFKRLVRGCKRTFSPFHRGVVTTYALEVGAAGDGDYRDQSFSAFRAARCLIHGTLPIFHR